MKKIAALIFCSVLMLASTISVSAKTNKNSTEHYDFYGKAGPTIEKNVIVIIDESIFSTATLLMAEIDVIKPPVIVPADAGIKPAEQVDIIYETIPLKVERSTKHQVTTNEILKTELTFNLQRPERSVSDYWPDTDYGLSKETKDVLEPPLVMNSGLKPMAIPKE